MNFDEIENLNEEDIDLLYNNFTHVELSGTAYVYCYYHGNAVGDGTIYWACKCDGKNSETGNDATRVYCMEWSTSRSCSGCASACSRYCR